MNTTDRVARFPAGRAITLESLSRDPYRLLATLREQEPVSWVPDAGMWFVTRRADVIRVLRDWDTFTTDSPHSTIRDTFGEHMLTTDGEPQRRYKRACLPAFRMGQLEKTIGPWIEDRVDGLIKRLPGSRAELRAGLAAPLALHAVMKVLGIPERLAGDIREWYEAFADALQNFQRDPTVRTRGKAAAATFRETIGPLLPALEREERRALLGRLAAEQWSSHEITSNALIILFGGIETTESMILNAIWAVWSHPDALARVRRDPSLLHAAIEESLRWEPAVQTCTRHTTRDVELDGVVIPSGDTVQCMLGAANRDPSHFTDPDRFDISRENAADHLSFGIGSHFCLGAPLARLETRIAMARLLSHLPDMRLDPGRPSAPSGYEFRKPPELWVRTG
jgi:cytochrome P450